MSQFDEIYSQHFSDVYKYSFSLCRNKSMAEEITQETFFKALKSIDGFRGNCKLRVWLCQIAKNTYFSHCQKEKKGREEQLYIEQISVEDFEDNLINHENAFEIHKALHKLDEPYKEVFTLRVLGELPFCQIAEILGKTESWARVTYHRAKIKLKENLI